MPRKGANISLSSYDDIFETDESRADSQLEKEMPDTTRLKAKERPIGGLGLFMLKRTMDHMTYDYLDGKNILTIEKRIR